MNYINLTAQIQLTESEIRSANPNTSFGNPFTAPEGYALVFPVPQPEHNPVLQKVQETQPELTAKGHWQQSWKVTDLYTKAADKKAATAADVEKKRQAAVPVSVKMRQARRALLAAGLLETVQTNVQLLDQAAQIDWEFAETVERNSQLVMTLSTLLNMTELDVDNLFTAAAKI